MVVWWFFYGVFNCYLELIVIWIFLFCIVFFVWFLNFFMIFLGNRRSVFVFWGNILRRLLVYGYCFVVFVDYCI